MKDAYYFPHDSNAKDDPKIVMLIEQLGLEGYGIFWALVETLRDQPGYRYPLKLVPALARRYNTTAEKMKAVIMSYELFETEDDEFFYSNSLRQRMLHYDEKRDKARKAAQIRWQSKSNASALQSQSTPNASKVEYSTVDHSKKKKGETPPNFDEFLEYALNKAYEYNITLDKAKVKAKYDAWKENNWRTGKDKKIRNWKTTLLNTLNYIKDDNKTQTKADFNIKKIKNG